ncbi:mitochondrial carrier domain-containing protein [Stachybotrys elegans]|uniref:Mitochondrial thiamine pyrophosphate carrier 1 n=1 Tax=Stachybotrys elegans TaxID=80388 RepID=A0A8K0SR48_9HYPO|nr:mitochondrial carrier domain-containing protein [Stachybotrys elegans]
MRVSKLAIEVEHTLEESQNQRDARVEQLWTRLAPADSSGELDLKGLQKGFRKLDHPMKNADDLIKQIMHEVDTNRDGKIQFEEFRTFVEEAERQLYVLFKLIDKDGNGKLDKRELQVAFKTAGLTVSNRRLSEFFEDMDRNNDGYVTFEEWRNFLLFLPTGGYDTRLHAVLSYYNSVVNVTPEGDSTVREETLEGLGMEASSRSIFHDIFGSLLRVAFPFGQSPISASKPRISSTDTTSPTDTSSSSSTTTTTENLAMDARLAEAGYTVEDLEGQRMAAVDEADDGTEGDLQDPVSTGALKGQKTFRLTAFIPDPGYFLAGAIAGGVSRTATAPLDRLKVYLLVNTKTGSDSALEAIKRGRPLAALQTAATPFRDAVKDLFRSGGFKGFFAGNGLNVIKIMPETAIKFGSYEAAKRALANFEGHGDPKKINSYSKFTAGGVAGMIAQFCVYPLDTLKFRLQCETVKGGLTGSALVRQTAVKMYGDGGLRACYRGVTMGLVGMFPYSAIDMGTFELLKKSYKTWYAKRTGCHEDDAEPGNIATGMIGATSGAFGASVVYPLNVVRTRLQTQGTVMHKETYTGIWDVTQKTIKREGYRGLYKGLTPNLLKVAPALSITWVVYENMKKVLKLD